MLIGSLGRRITSQKGESREWRDLYSFNVIHENSPPEEWNLCNDPPCYASIAEYTSASIETDKIIEPYRPTTIRRIGGVSWVPISGSETKTKERVGEEKVNREPFMGSLCNFYSRNS